MSHMPSVKMKTEKKKLFEDRCAKQDKKTVKIIEIAENMLFFVRKTAEKCVKKLHFHFVDTFLGIIYPFRVSFSEDDLKELSIHKVPAIRCVSER